MNRVLQKSQMNLVLLCVWADWAVLGSTNTAQQKLKYATFGVFFSCFHGHFFNNIASALKKVHRIKERKIQVEPTKNKVADEKNITKTYRKKMRFESTDFR